MPISLMEEPQSKSLTLYEAEGYLAELLETEGAVPEDQLEAFGQELARSLAATQEKRERVAQFILQCEAGADFCKREEARIRGRRQILQNTAERVRGYVLGWIMSQGFDAQAKFRKLIGKTTTMSARANPASVDIYDEEAVPARFKTALIEMPLEMWYRLVDQHPDETAGALKQVAIDKRMVKEAIGHGEEVQGADLNIGKYSLQIR
jgi:hypothetical protein